MLRIGIKRYDRIYKFSDILMKFSINLECLTPNKSHERAVCYS